MSAVLAFLRKSLGFIRAYAVLVLLVSAALLGAVAWQLQSSAADDLSRARAVQQQDTGDGGGEPPDVGEYRAILDALNRSIVIRRNIDSSLAQIEKVVASLRDEQQEAADIAAAGKRQITGIAETLGSAAGAARATTGAVETLDDLLVRSARLSALIAEELEELDRTFGPTLDEDLKDLVDDIVRNPR